jgi:hypothetical protein
MTLTASSAWFLIPTALLVWIGLESPRLLLEVIGRILFFSLAAVGLFVTVLLALA